MSAAPTEKLALKSEWQLSGASEGQRLGTIALGVANVVRSQLNRVRYS